MTHKTFYQLAAAEVAAGRLDDALWIKVNAELPNSDDKTRQAKYITMRAKEMAADNAKHRLARWVPQSVAGWLVCLVVAFAIFMVVGTLINFLSR